MKFGKQIQKQQLDLPEYASSFLNYKALKKLIKQLSATPTITAQNSSDQVDAKAALRANKEVFFFRLEREIEKVNVFYVQKEAEFSLRLKTLLEKKRTIQARIAASSKVSASFATLVEGFQQFDNDLNKLQLFVEVNETAISKILKKWDKTSKSRTKELYLQRAVEIQPCFNRDVLRDLSDRATTSRLDLEAWAEGENISYDATQFRDRAIGQRVGTEDSDIDVQILQAAAAGNLVSLREWISRLSASPNATERFTRVFLASISDSTEDALATLLNSGLVDAHAEDDINERNCLHEAAIYGKDYVVEYALHNRVDLSGVDAYGRTPLHYACLKGRADMTQKLLEASPATINLKDHDNFTALVHSIIRGKISCFQVLLQHNAQIDPSSIADHAPLNLACQHGSVEIVRMLLERNAKLLPDAEGLYPQHLVARSSFSPDLLLLLKQHGADLNQRDKAYSWTPLFHAASEGRVDCLRALLENGADVLALDEKGLSALYYATWEGHLECMNLLWESSSRNDPGMSPNLTRGNLVPRSVDSSMEMMPSRSSAEGDGIPDLSLPPPIIPLRRYGHNFLDSKTLVSLNFNRGADAIKFFNAARYPAARITISSKSSDLIPRNIMLPIQEDARTVTFQIDNLQTFAIDFEVFPTFGSKVIAKSVALPDTFLAIESSSGVCCLPLFDPRLRAIGQIQFSYQVIKPYTGVPLEIAQFATYWKATSALDDRTGLVTGSSLSGDYLQLPVQLTKDGIPVIYPEYMVSRAGFEIPVASLQHATITELLRTPSAPLSTTSLDSLHDSLSSSFITLEEVLRGLPVSINVNLQILYPTTEEEAKIGLGVTKDINTFTDEILGTVFDHARASKNVNPDFMRSIVFSSENPQICTAFNWKQPNFPVLLSNKLGGAQGTDPAVANPSTLILPSSSIKESARLAQNSNLIGLICRSEILQMVPSMIETIKEAGLVLVSEISSVRTGAARHGSDAFVVAQGVNGVMKPNGILRFNESVDI